MLRESRFGGTFSDAPAVTGRAQAAPVRRTRADLLFFVLVLAADAELRRSRDPHFHASAVAAEQGDLDWSLREQIVQGQRAIRAVSQLDLNGFVSTSAYHQHASVSDFVHAVPSGRALRAEGLRPFGS